MGQYSIKHLSTAQVLMDLLELRYSISIIHQSWRDLLDIVVDLLEARVVNSEVRL